MSLASLMLAFLPAFIQPKREPDKTAREAELEAVSAELERAWAERDSWRRRCEDAQATLGRIALDRIDRQLEQRAQYQDGLAAMQAAQYAQAQQLAAQQSAQMNAQQAMRNMLNSYQYQALQNVCNCVPARHDMLLGAIGGA